jgi:hypothetical protein
MIRKSTTKAWVTLGFLAIAVALFTVGINGWAGAGLFFAVWAVAGIMEVVAERYDI